MSESRLVEVYRARDGTQAHLLRTMLEEAGIPTCIEGEQLQGAVGGLPTGWSIAPRLVVEAEHASQARALLESWEKAPPCGDADGDAGEGPPTGVEEADDIALPSRSDLVPSPPGLLGWHGHVVGVFSILWAAASWIEWFAVPVLLPDREGPVPYLDVAPLSVALFFGCVWFTIQLLFFPMGLGWRTRLLYAAFPSSFVAFFLTGFAFAVL